MGRVSQKAHSLNNGLKFSLFLLRDCHSPSQSADQDRWVFQIEAMCGKDSGHLKLH